MKKGEMLSNMIALAAMKHKGQLDKQGQPNFRTVASLNRGTKGE